MNVNNENIAKQLLKRVKKPKSKYLSDISSYNMKFNNIIFCDSGLQISYNYTIWIEKNILILKFDYFKKKSNFYNINNSKINIYDLSKEFEKLDINNVYNYIYNCYCFDDHLDINYENIEDYLWLSEFLGSNGNIKNKIYEYIWSNLKDIDVLIKLEYTHSIYIILLKFITKKINVAKNDEYLKYYLELLIKWFSEYNVYEQNNIKEYLRKNLKFLDYQEFRNICKKYPSESSNILPLDIVINNC